MKNFLDQPVMPPWRYAASDTIDYSNKYLYYIQMYYKTNIIRENLFAIYNFSSMYEYGNLYSRIYSRILNNKSLNTLHILHYVGL